MEIADSWAQVIAAVGGFAGFTALGVEVIGRRKRRKRPSDELIASLNWLHETLGDIIAVGGKESPWYLEPERRRQESLLAILNGQIVDDKLNEQVGVARSWYNTAFSWSPGKRIQQQVEAAEKSRVACTAAINRANALKRKYSG